MEENKNELIEINELGIVVDTNIDSFFENKEEYIKMDVGNLAQIDSLMQYIPDVLLNKQLDSGVYRVVFDKGLGSLQRAKDFPGMFRGAIVKAGTNNEIVGSALWQELSKAPQYFANAFNVLSIITGQYYLSKINTELKHIDEKVANILDFLKNDKISMMKADALEIKKISDNYSVIMQNEALRNSKLNKIESIKRDAEANIIFYQDLCKKLKDYGSKKDKEAIIIQNINNSSEAMSCYWMAVQLYSFASVFEVALSGMCDGTYIEYIKTDLGDINKAYRNVTKTLEQSLNKYLKEAKAFDDNKLLKYGAEIPVSTDSVGAFLITLGAKATLAWLDDNDKNKKLKLNNELMLKSRACIADRQSDSADVAIECLNNYSAYMNSSVELVFGEDGTYIKRI